MRQVIIQACTDLGTHKRGTEMGPVLLLNNIDFNGKVYVLKKDKIAKTYNKEDKLKNLEGVNKFNQELYNTVNFIVENDYIPITLGGDHSITIATALASIKYHHNMGIIWIDSHGDYNTEDTTMTGNIHGLPFAAITGYQNKMLTSFHQGEFYNPKKAVLVGARSLDELEIINLTKAGITVFTTEDIKTLGVKKVMCEAIEIASSETNGIHISFDIDLVDPDVAPGVSVPEDTGINEHEALTIMKILRRNKKLIKSFDLVEFNPVYDIDNKTLEFTTKLLKTFIEQKISLKV